MHVSTQLSIIHTNNPNRFASLTLSFPSGDVVLISSAIDELEAIGNVIEDIQPKALIILPDESAQDTTHKQEHGKAHQPS